MSTSANILGNTKRKVFLSALLSICCALIGACSNAESDAALKRTFQTHSKEFEQLVAMSQSDRGVTRIPVTGTPLVSSPMAPKRWDAYQSLFQNLGLKEGLERKEGFPSGIFLIEECWGTAKTHECKGYVYSEVPLTPHDNHDVFKPLARNWYLFSDDATDC